MMRCLIFGASGRLGQVCVRLFRERGAELICPSHADCDLRDPQRVSAFVLAQQGLQAVVNCAAMSSLEACLDDPVSAHFVNAMAPAAMALACRHTGARFVQLSTDYVLDGRRVAPPRAEDARCRPCSVYGESKREGELQVQEALPEALVARVSWICGNPARPAFVESVAQRALAGLPLAAVADKFSKPTDAYDIADVLWRLLLLPDSRGVYHVCAEGEPLSWRDCACTIVEFLAEEGLLPLSGQVALPVLLPQALDEVPFFRDVRPRYTAMDPARLRALGVVMPDVRATLRAVLRRWLQSRGA